MPTTRYISYNDEILHAEGADNKAYREWLLKYIYAIINSNMLTKRQKEVMRLYYIDDNTQQETADLLKLNISTVNRHIKAAEKKIRKLFLEVYENV